MNASTAFEKRKDELLAQLEQASGPEKAAEAAVMTLEMIACDLAQDEQDALLRQRQQAVLALARRAPAMLRAARAEGELVLAAQAENSPQRAGKIGLRGAGALLLAALAVALLVDGKIIFAVLQAAGAGMMLMDAMRPAQQAERPQARGIARADAQEMIRMLSELCRAADVCVSDLQLIDQESTSARLSGTADEAMIDLLVSLLEARATGRPEVALRSLDQAQTYLRMLGIETASFSRENAQMFDVLPTLSGERTIRPALLKDGKVIRRGVAACAQAQGAAR